MNQSFIIIMPDLNWINLSLLLFIFKPKAVFFSCMDSRMLPSRFTQTNVGDMFIVRNAGNLIPHSKWFPAENTTTEPAALELGCVVNNIKHVIVCGHSDCKVSLSRKKSK